MTNKIILGLIIFLSILSIVLSYKVFVKPVTYSPKGMWGTAIPFYSAGSEPYKCDICKGDAYLYKVDSRDRIICDTCYDKIMIR